MSTSIQKYITQYLHRKLSSSPTLLVYDALGRYHELVKELEGEAVHVVDATKSFILAREEAQRIFTEILPENDRARLILYLPYDTPADNQARIQDPFFIFGLGGAIFPYGPADRYAELCKGCYPGQEDKIEALFADGDPSFETIDALGAGNTYALLQTLTGGKSDAEIVLKLMTATEDLASSWKKQKGIGSEWKAFAKQQLSLKSNNTSLPTIQQELWRFVLFSEFVYDLPVPLPPTFTGVQRGEEKQRNLILGLCETIRLRKDLEDIYVERAEAVDSDLGLSDQFAQETNLGEIITFSFEDNTYFHRFISDILTDNPEQAAREWSAVQGNIWEGHDPQRAANWKVARCGAELIRFAENLSDSVIRSQKTLSALTDRYSNDWYRFDQLQRTFEQSVDSLLDRTELVETFIKRIRQTYRQWSEAIQNQYQNLIEQEGWPGSLSFQNTSIWAKYIEPNLKTNIPTAYIWADALRFELGKEVSNALSTNGHSIDLLTSASFVPTVTKLAMAALLPGADQKLYLRRVGNELEAELDGILLKTLQDRVGFLQSRLGDRLLHQSVDKFLNSGKSKPVDLLCLSFTEIDTSGESLGSNALLSIQEAAKKIIKTVNKLKQAGYRQVVIAADHGFMLHPDYEPGDSLAKPSGDWWLAKKRCLAGKGMSGDAFLSFTAEQLSLRSDANQFVFPKQFAVFQANTRYFHEGLSLQENIVPVILVKMENTKAGNKADVILSYKKSFITSRRPSIQMAAFSDQLFSDPLTVRVEAFDKIQSGKVIGMLADQKNVNILAGTVEITPGSTMSITLEMEDDFEGDFIIVASNPATGKIYHNLHLKTEYSS